MKSISKTDKPVEGGPHNISEVLRNLADWHEKYAKWYASKGGVTTDDDGGGNPGGPPPPPPPGEHGHP